MIKDAVGKLSSIPDRVHILIGILVFGSIWGLLEATLGGVMHLINFPNTGAIMGGIGMLIMATALACYRKPVMSIGIGIVAASFKLLNVWLLLIPANVPHIINPIAAIILESIAFSLVSSFLLNAMSKNNYVIVWAAVLAGILSAFTFALVAVYVTHIPINSLTGIFSVREFVMVNGLVQAVFAGVLAPLGFVAGRKLVTAMTHISERKLVFYGISVATILGCVGLSALATMVGL